MRATFNAGLAVPLKPELVEKQRALLDAQLRTQQCVQTPTEPAAVPQLESNQRPCLRWNRAGVRFGWNRIECHRRYASCPLLRAPPLAARVALYDHGPCHPCSSLAAMPPKLFKRFTDAEGMRRRSSGNSTYGASGASPPTCVDAPQRTPSRPASTGALGGARGELSSPLLPNGAGWGGDLSKTMRQSVAQQATDQFAEAVSDEVTTPLAQPLAPPLEPEPPP